MAHVKVNRQSPSLDMTPMVDLAFLLVTFFMLTTQFSPEQPVVVDTPASSASAILEEKDLITISFSKEGIVFFDVSGKYTREELIKKIGSAYKINFAPSEVNRFSILSTFGIPIGDLAAFLAMSPAEQKAFRQAGIPCDSLHNELTNWIAFSASINPQLKIVVKGDQDANHLVVRKVISTLVNMGITKFDLITDMEESY